MFRKTQTKIYRTLMLTAALFIILLIVPSVLIFTNMIYTTYETMAKKKLERSFYSCRNFIDSVMTSTENLTYDAAVIETVSGTRDGSLAAVLDAACNYSLTINAIAVYDLNGNVYTSSGVAGAPTLDELCENEGIADFVADRDAADFVSIRNSQIAKIYGGTNYDDSLGIVSCLYKIYNADGLAGYAVSDVFPSALFGFFSYPNDAYFKNSVAMISYADGHLISDANYAYAEALESAIGSLSVTRQNGHIVVPGTRNFYGGMICIAVPLNAFYGTVAMLTGILLTLGGALMAAVHFIAKKNSVTVAARLDELYGKMERDTRRFTGQQ